MFTRDKTRSITFDFTETTMSSHKIFVDRRRGDERRLDNDPCKDMPIDIYHRKRRKSTDRRHPQRTLVDDYQAYLGNLESKATH